MTSEERPQVQNKKKTNPKTKAETKQDMETECDEAMEDRSGDWDSRLRAWS